jgi:hypothetical protein
MVTKWKEKIAHYATLVNRVNLNVLSSEGLGIQKLKKLTIKLTEKSTGNALTRELNLPIKSGKKLIGTK